MIMEFTLFDFISKMSIFKYFHYFCLTFIKKHYNLELSFMFTTLMAVYYYPSILYRLYLARISFIRN